MSSKLALLLKPGSKRPAAPSAAGAAPSDPLKPKKRRKQQSQQQHGSRHHTHKRQRQQLHKNTAAHTNGAAAAAAAAGTGGPGDSSDEEGDDNAIAPAVPAEQAYDTLLALLAKSQQQRGKEAAAAAAGGGKGGGGKGGSSTAAAAGSTKQRKAQQQQQQGLRDGDASGSESEGDDGGSSSEESEGEDKPHQQPEGTANEEDEEQQKQPAAAAADGQQQQHGEDGDGDAGGAAAAAADGGAGAGSTVNNSSSTWESYMSTELSEQQAAALMGGGPLTWHEVASNTAAAGAGGGGGGGGGEGQQQQQQHDPSEGLWKRAKWQFSGRSGFPPCPPSLSGYGVKERLIARWREVVHQEDAERLAGSDTAAAGSSKHKHKQSSRQQQQQQPQGGDAGGGASGGDFVSPQQQLLFSLLDSYADVLYSAKPYPGGPGWNPDQPDEAMDAVLLHVLNHCAKTADVIKKNNDKIKGLDPGAVEAVPRDQGFTRPKALILLPLRNNAYAVVKRLVALAQRETRADSVQGKEKFVEQFIGEEDEQEGGGAGGGDTAAAAAAAAAGGGTKSKSGVPKPAEHRALFHGNIDDHFRLGIRITRGQIKLFADPMQSDIIVASPVGLATKLAEDAAAAAAAAGGGGGGGGGKKGGQKGGGGGAGGGGAGGSSSSSSSSGAADFLSSIEVCVIERADVMLMQNWQHVVTVLEALNHLPKQQHGVNIMRVKLHLLASQGAMYRQTIMTSSFTTPQLNSTFNKLTHSHAGKFRLVVQPSGVLSQVVPQVRQLFERFSCASPAAAADARFEYFKTQVWPRLSDADGAGGSGSSGGLLLVVPNYFDFLRVRNFLKSEEVGVSLLSEYSSFPQVTRARATFFQRRSRLMLYSERAHFYHRYRIRGIQDILFYSLPEHAHFYAELINLVQVGGGGGGGGSSSGGGGGAAAAAGHHATITTLFCQQTDALALARVVGHSRAGKMLAPTSSPTFVFC